VSIEIVGLLNREMERKESLHSKAILTRSRALMRVPVRDVLSMMGKRRYRKWAREDLTPRRARVMRVAVRKDPALGALKRSIPRVVRALADYTTILQETTYHRVTEAIAAELSATGADALWVVTEAELAEVRAILVNGETPRDAYRRILVDFATKATRAPIVAVTQTMSIGAAQAEYGRVVRAAHKTAMDKIASIAGELAVGVVRYAARKIAEGKVGVDAS
jgi:hypothetical protein